jgi:hypothetical protein
LSNYDDELVYTNKQVLRILTLYWNLWALFETKSVPFNEGTRFSEPYASKPPKDGKGKTRRREDVLCSLFDIEESLYKLHPDTRQMIMDYYILDKRDVGNESERIKLHRAVKALTRAMNGRNNDDGNSRS